MTFFKPLAVTLLFSILIFGCTQQTNSLTGKGLSVVTKVARQAEPQNPGFLVPAGTETTSSPDGNGPKKEPDANVVIPDDLTKFCLVPKFDVNQTHFAYLNSVKYRTEFNPVDINLFIPNDSQKCYFYENDDNKALVYPLQQMRLRGDAAFDTNYLLQDLVEHIRSPGDYRYVESFTNPIPTGLDFNNDTAVIPFMGGRYKILGFTLDSNSIMSVELQNLARPTERFLVQDNERFPISDSSRKWVAQINELEGNRAALKNIHIVNELEIWDENRGHNAPLYGLDNLHGVQPNSADFLNGTGHPKEDFAKIWFNGFESKPKTNIKIGGTSINSGGFLEFDDANVSYRHKLAFSIRLNARSSGSSFNFDYNNTIYYKFDNNANIFSYRYDLNGNWNNISYVEGNVTSRFPLIGGANQTYYYRLFVDNTESDGYLILDAASLNNIIWTKYRKSIEFLGTDINEDGRIDKQYYTPNIADFGGGTANEYWIAHFKIKEVASRHSSEIFEFIDTLYGIPPSLPNNNLSYYDSDLNYSNSFGVKWKIRQDQPYLQKAFTDYGTRIDLDLNSGYPTAVIHVLPESDARVSLRIDVKEK